MGTARQAPLNAMRDMPREFIEWLEETIVELNARIDRLTGASGNIPKFDSDGGLEDSEKVPPSGVIVGDTDEQTLVNKTLTSPNVTTPTITGGTLNQPTINQPVLDKPNATDMSDMNHDHEDTTGGGTLGVSALGIAFKDEDDMASNSAAAVASQQSIKKYVDDSVPSGWTGSFTNGDGDTVTVANGIITGVV